MPLFTREKLAIEYLNQHGIAKTDPRRDDILCAFCAGYSIGSDKLTVVSRALERLLPNVEYLAGGRAEVLNQIKYARTSLAAARGD